MDVLLSFAQFSERSRVSLRNPPTQPPLLHEAPGGIHLVCSFCAGPPPSLMALPGLVALPFSSAHVLLIKKTLVCYSSTRIVNQPLPPVLLVEGAEDEGWDKKWRCWSRYAASREDPLRAVIPPPRGPASFPCSVNQPEAVRRSSSTLKPSPPRGPQCRVSFWNGAAAFGVSLNPRSSTHATNPSTHMPRKHGYSPLLRRAGEQDTALVALLTAGPARVGGHYGTQSTCSVNASQTKSKLVKSNEFMG